MDQPLFFQIRVTGEGTVEYRLGAECGWARDVGRPPPEVLRSQAVWDALRDGGEGRELEIGQRLGRWLYDSRAARLLGEHARAGRSPMRIELCLPPSLAGYPWELAAPDGMLPLGVHSHFTVVRTHPEPLPDVPVPVRRLDVLLVGVQCDEVSEYGTVLTEHELEAIRTVIASHPSGAFSVQIDPCGSWDELVSRSKRLEPPQVFHFAGHGLPREAGLVFRGADGGARKIPVDRLVTWLASGPGQRKPHLVFLNACYSAGTDGADHPLGGMVKALHRHGIAAVVGMQSRVADRDAQALATGFYARLAEGDPIDAALQSARRDLYLKDSKAWPFVVLSVRGSPGPLVAKTSESGSPADTSRFGFGAQYEGIRMLVGRRQPAVVIVHGQRRRGHRQCLGRLRQELERSNAALWRPVAEFQYYGTNEPLLRRAQLAGAMAKALGLSDQGTQAQLEERIAELLVERTRERVLLIEIVHPIIPATEDEAQAVFTLVGELWATLVARAREHSSELPALLLVPIAYDGRRGWRGYPRTAKRTRDVISRLEHEREGCVIEVLPELEPFRAEELEKFFRVTCDRPPKDARRLASDMLRAGDNEAILERMDQLMARWTR
ncbi:MAG: CHAT domain-containing protein [Polyangiaceae bacterium]|nr:CHAT domain-containing protein [Polyangiaceae bacterium]